MKQPSRPLSSRKWLIASATLIAAVLLFGLTAALPGSAARPNIASPETVAAVSAADPSPESYLIRDYQAFPSPSAAASEATPLDLAADVTLKLVVVLALIVGLAWVFRRSQGILPQTGGRLRRAESMTLTPQATIHLVEVGARVLVVGVTAQQVSLLAELDAEETADTGGTAEGSPERPAFVSFFRSQP